jgi:uncharacterized membrane protein YqjE
MSASTGAESKSDTQTPPPVVSAAQRLLASVWAMLQTRLAIAGIELAEARERFLRTVVWTAFALLFAGLALFAVSVLIVVLCWDSCRILALVGVVIGHAGLAMVCVLRIRALVRGAPAFLAITLNELEKDCEVLRS